MAAVPLLIMTGRLASRKRRKKHYKEEVKKERRGATLPSSLSSSLLSLSLTDPQAECPRLSTRVREGRRERESAALSLRHTLSRCVSLNRSMCNARSSLDEQREELRGEEPGAVIARQTRAAIDRLRITGSSNRFLASSQDRWYLNYHYFFFQIFLQ